VRVQNLKFVALPVPQVFTNCYKGCVYLFCLLFNDCYRILERVINIWNSLPVTVNFSTLKYFRRTIQSVDFSSFLKCS